MTDIVSPLLQWLNTNPQWAGLVIFAVSAGESAPIFGTLVPGSITMTAFGALMGAGVIPMWSSLLWAIAGAICGDSIGYWIGHYFKDKLHSVWPFKKNPSLLKKGELFFGKYGGMSVFIGRFIGPVRALVPLVAGMLGMSPLRFSVANIASAVGWAPAYMLPGILLGAASLELPPEIAVHFILVLFLIFLFILLCLWFIYKIALLIQQRVNRLQDKIWRILKSRPYLSPITVLLKHYSPLHSHGQLNLAIGIIFISFLLLSLLILVHVVGSDHLMMNDVVYHLFRGLRSSHTIDTLMLNITLLGQKQVILPVFLALFIWLLVCQRWRAAWHTLTLGILASGSVYVIKHLMQSTRPWGIVGFNSFSTPSGHTTLATVVFMGLAFLIAQSVRPKYRWPFYFLGGSISLLVGLSRLYLGAHWFTDVLIGWLLSITLLMLVILSYQRETEPRIPFSGILIVTGTTFAITFTFFHYIYFAQTQANYAQIHLSKISIKMGDWWQHRNQFPADHTSLFGFPSQEINVEWLGDLDQIRTSLQKQGWIKPPMRDFISTIHRIADISSTQYLPMISPQYLDRKPVLILTKQQDKETVFVIRLWHSNLTMPQAKHPLWVGTVGIVPRSYSWLFKNRSANISLEPQLFFSQNTKNNFWEWKLAIAKDTQPILLVRKKN